MADGRSRKASKPGAKQQVSRKAAGTRQATRATARKRTVVLDGTFSIDEIEEQGTSRRRAAKPAEKKPAKQATRTAKRAARPKARKKPAVAELGPVVLASQPGIKNIAELKEQLTAALGSGSAVTVDAAKVESIDTAALQLLVAFANSVRERSGTVEWKQPSTVFREMADLADLSRCLGIGEGSIADEDDGLCPVF